MPENFKDSIRDEDKPMLEAIQRRMKDRDFWSMEPLLLTVDGAAVLSRRILQKMIDTEDQHRPSPAPGHPMPATRIDR
jgi:hypothetical protein